MATETGAPVGRRPTGAAFLLTQLGTHAASRYAERIAPLGMTPAQSGLLRLVAAEPGRSQQAVAAHLGVHASRVVVLVDGLQHAGLLERRRDPRDRRNYALHLTEQGRTQLADLRRAASDHEAELCTALTDDEHTQLTELLRRIADQQGLTPGVHPGYADTPGTNRRH